MFRKGGSGEGREGGWWRGGATWEHLDGGARTGTWEGVWVWGGEREAREPLGRTGGRWNLRLPPNADPRRAT